MFGCEKFTDNYPDKAKTDIDFQNAQNGRKINRKNYFGKAVKPVAMQGVD